MPTDNDPKSTPPAEPFRKQAVWGRPPQTTFRAGPLPRGERLPPLPEFPPARPEVIATPRAAVPPQQPPQPVGSRPDIFSGSMIPRAAYKPTPPLPTQMQTQTPATSVAPPIDTAPKASDPDLTVRPLPVATPVEPTPTAARPNTQAPATAPLAPPSVTPAPVSIQDAAPVRSRARATPKASRLPLVVGGAIAALAVVGAGVWWVNRAPVTPVTPIISPLEATPPAATTPVDIAPAAITPLEASTPSATTVAAPAATRPAPTAAVPTTTARATPPPANQPARATASANTTPEPTPSPSVQPAPVIVEIAPAQPAGPPPTTAAPRSSDPDAPVVTRPQPLD